MTVNLHRSIPIVSIGMPAYNDAKYIREAIETLLSQTFMDFELLISDNASTDDTGAICEEFANKDLRINYFRQNENIGPSANFMYTLKKARGEFFMWAASDDAWSSDFLKLMIEALRDQKNAALAFCPYTILDEEGRVLQQKAIDYSSSNVLLRLLKLCYYYDDGCFYGVYRRSFLDRVEFPKWKWIYAKTPLNGAYPVLFHVLSQGDYVLTGKGSLWFNRVHLDKETVMKKGTYQAVSSNLFIWYLASIVHKINVMIVCASLVYKGTTFLGIAVVSLLPLSLRCCYDCISLTFKLILNLMRKVVDLWR